MCSRSRYTIERCERNSVFSCTEATVQNKCSKNMHTKHMHTHTHSHTHIYTHIVRATYTTPAKHIFIPFFCCHFLLRRLFYCCFFFFLFHLLIIQSASLIIGTIQMIVQRSALLFPVSNCIYLRMQACMCVRSY